LINRRSSHPNHPHASLSQFDYLPTGNNLMPPSFGQAGEFEASLHSSEFFQGMFEFGRPAAPALSPLMIQDTSMLHSLVSPVSSNSSGPSSPHSGPFTPTTTMLANSFSNLCSFSNNGELAANVVVGSETSTEIDMQTEFQQLQQGLYSNYSWEANSIWQTCASNNVGMMTDILLGDDFDLSAIPPIELGLPKFGDDFASTSPTTMDAAHFHHDETRNVDGMFGFDEMTSRHGF
jgi:hypothetical protein